MQFKIKYLIKYAKRSECLNTANNCFLDADFGFMKTKAATTGY